MHQQFPAGARKPGLSMSGARWIDEWLRAWQAFPDAGAGNPWTAMLEHFAKAHPASGNPALADALDKITGQSRAFFDLGQQLASNDGASWQDSVLEYLDELAGRVQDPTAAELLGAASPLHYWGRFAGHDGDPATGQQAATAQLETLLRMPGVGWTREHQESVQELTRLWLDYQKTYREYAVYCAETSRLCVERLRRRLQEAFAAGGGPATIRELYDAWVACGEEVHGERVATDEYARLHGRMINSLMAYRRQASLLMDEWAKAANLPSREEVDTLHRRLKETREALRDLKGDRGGAAKKKRKKKSTKKPSTKKPSKKQPSKKQPSKKQPSKKKPSKKKPSKKKPSKKKPSKKKPSKKKPSTKKPSTKQ